MNRKKIIITLSIFLNILLIGFSLFCIKNLGGRRFFFQKYLDEKNNTNITISQAKSQWFNDFEIKENSIIMLGDSLTDNVSWNELIGDNVINRGIGGNKSNDVLKRLNEIISRNPSKVFIMIGINDLASHTSVDELISNYSKIIDDIKKGTPNTSIYIQSILPINRNRIFLDITNEDIKNANKRIETLSNEKNVKFIDLYDKFESDGKLNSSFTFDGLHLNGNGYKVWKDNILTYIKD